MPPNSHTAFQGKIRDLRESEDKAPPQVGSKALAAFKRPQSQRRKDLSPFGARLDVNPCLQRAPQSGSCLNPFGTGTGPGAGELVELGRELDFDSWPQKNQRLKRPHHRVSPLVFHKDDDPQRKRPYHKHPVRSGKHTRGHLGPNIRALNSSANGKPGEAQSVGPGPREGPGKAYVWGRIFACGSIDDGRGRFA